MSKQLPPDAWVAHIERLEEAARERARAQQTDAYGVIRDRDHYDEDAIRTMRVGRWQVFADIAKHSSWSRERFTVEYANTGDGDRVTFSCTCQDGQRDALCVHRAYKEWCRRYNAATLRDDDPDEWTLTFDAYKQNDYTFDWALLE